MRSTSGSIFSSSICLPRRMSVIMSRTMRLASPLSARARSNSLPDLRAVATTGAGAASGCGASGLAGAAATAGGSTATTASGSMPRLMSMRISWTPVSRTRRTVSSSPTRKLLRRKLCSSQLHLRSWMYTPGFRLEMGIGLITSSRPREFLCPGLSNTGMRYGTGPQGPGRGVLHGHLAVGLRFVTGRRPRGHTLLESRISRTC